MDAIDEKAGVNDASAGRLTAVWNGRIVGLPVPPQEHWFMSRVCDPTDFTPGSELVEPNHVVGGE